MNATTIKINSENSTWWKRCCKAKNMSSQELFAEFEKQVKLKKQQAFYNGLSMPNNYRNPLLGIKINKKYTKNSSIL